MNIHPAGFGFKWSMAKGESLAIQPHNGEVVMVMVREAPRASGPRGQGKVARRLRGESQPLGHQDAMDRDLAASPRSVNENSSLNFQ